VPLSVKVPSRLPIAPPSLKQQAVAADQVVNVPVTSGTPSVGRASAETCRGPTREVRVPVRERGEVNDAAFH